MANKQNKNGEIITKYTKTQSEHEKEPTEKNERKVEENS